MHDETSIIEASKDRPRSEMTRGTQTAWIVATLIVLGLVGLYFATRVGRDDYRYGCQELIGFDEDCVLYGTGRFR